MKNNVDLHMHTNASDGTDTPEEIISKARSLNMALISITDHDTVGALSAAISESRKQGVRFITGVELSVMFHHPSYAKGQKGVELHLLGYNFDHNSTALVDSLKEISDYRIWRAQQIIEKVNAVMAEQHLPLITAEEFESLQKRIEGSLGRPHLAELLIEKQIVKTKQEAFDRYLVSCDVPKKHLTLAEGSRLIRDAGGTVVLAHPVGDKVFSFLKITDDLDRHLTLLESIRDYIDGLECYYFNHTDEQSSYYHDVANQMGLIITAGSDHHGGSEKQRLGQLRVPDDLADQLLEYFKIDAEH